MQPDLVVRHTNRLPEKENLQLIYKTLLAEHKSLSVMLISIDEFSDIVDAHGRNTGDDLLDKVVAYLAEHLREQDVLTLEQCRIHYSIATYRPACGF